MTDLARSPLHDAHVRLGARLVPFGGWEMPLSYPSGTVAEHLACRQRAAAFDVSHLGTVRVTGPEAEGRLQSTLTNDLGKIGPGRAQYTHLLDAADASVLDDIIVWWVADDRFDVMPNASNTERVRTAVGVDDVTHERAVIAVVAHTDSSMKNKGVRYEDVKQLSTDRTNAVKRALVNKYKFDPNKFRRSPR